MTRLQPRRAISGAKNHAATGMEPNRQNYPNWRKDLPILDRTHPGPLRAYGGSVTSTATQGALGSDTHKMELLEREQCLAELTGWLHAAAEKGGCVAFVAGEAGIGKTALVQAFSRQQSETRVLWGACDALFTPRPLAPLHDIARQTRGALLASIASEAHRDLIFNAALDELERDSETLVILENMHWADEATLDFLKFVGRRVHRMRALIAVTYRDDEV